MLTLNRRALALACVALLAVSGAWADKEEQQKEEEAEKVYTTEDLERMYGEPEPAAPEPSASDDDPLERLQQQQAGEAERKKLVAEAERKVAAAEKRVRELEQRILATKNPLLARPKIPDDEREEWNGQTAAQRVQASEAKLAQARKELAAAKAELARLVASR